MPKRLTRFNIVLILIIVLLIVSNYSSIFYHDEYLAFWIKMGMMTKEFIMALYRFMKGHIIWILNQPYDFSLNNRELALLILFSIFSAWALTQRKIRKSIFGGVKELFNKCFNRVYIEILLYTIFVIHILYQIKIWDFIYLKDTIIWVVFTAFYLAFRVADCSNPKSFKTVFIDVFSVTAVFEFLYNVYTFSLIIEIFVIVLLTFIGLIIAFTDAFPEKDGNGRVNRVFKLLQSYLGISILFFLIREIFINYRQLFQVEQLRAFMLPILLTILYLPYLFYLVTWTTYDQIEVELRQNTKLSFWQRQYFRLRTRLYCKFDKDAIQKFKIDKKHLIRNISSWAEIQGVFKLP